MDLQAALETEARRFVGDDPGRSVVVHLLDGPTVSVGVAADVVRPSASVVKILPALALNRAADRGEFDLDADVARAELGTTQFPSVLAAFEPRRRLSLREISAFSLITSDNPCAEYLRTLVGPERIDTLVDDLHLTRTRLRVGFTDAELGAAGRSNVTTAEEALRLLEHVGSAREAAQVRPLLINNLRNHRIPLRLEDDIPVMHKTGTLQGVVNDVGIVYHPAARVGLSFLCDRQPDSVLTSAAIGDTTQRIIESVASFR